MDAVPPGSAGRFHRHRDHALGKPQGGFHRLGQAAGRVLAHLQPINHRLQGVLAPLLRDFRQIAYFLHQAVDAGPEITLAPEHGEHVLVLSLPSPNQGRQDHRPFPHGLGHDAVDYLLRRLAGDGLAAMPAVGGSGAGVQEAEVVVNLGGGGHGGAGIGVALSLLDGDGGGQPGYGLDAGLSRRLQELPGVGRKAFHIAPLTFDVNGVEGEAGFAGAGEAGEDGKGVPGNVQIHPLEIVFASPANSDVRVFRHEAASLPGIGEKAGL